MKTYISIIILSFNVKDLVDQTLNSLLQSINYTKIKNPNLIFKTNCS